MSKITFRADDDLVRRLEAFDASKSEVMREALRAYLDETERESDSESTGAETVDDALRERVDALIEERLDALGVRPMTPSTPQDVNVNVTVDGATATERTVSEENTASESGQQPRKTSESRTCTCEQCGESVETDHVYCPNCGEKASHRVFCDCGDEIRSDWAFCPGCGRRTPAADVL